MAVGAAVDPEPGVRVSLLLVLFFSFLFSSSLFFDLVIGVSSY